MNTPKENHIRLSIKSYYKRRLLSAIYFLVGILVLSIFFPIRTLLFPAHFNTENEIDSYYRKNERYIQTELTDLYFTGYTRSFLGNTTGYYYYTMMQEECVIVLLLPNTSEMGLSHIESLDVTLRIMKGSPSLDQLIINLSKDLSWNEAGMRDASSEYMLSEPDALGFFAQVIRWAIILSCTYAILMVVVSLISILFPTLSHPVRRLRVYGNPKKMLLEAEEELSTLPQLATEDMFITEHYFIETSSDGVALMPIDRMLWVYKYSTLHKFLWHHFSISYTMYITAERHQYIRCPKNKKTDIDGIMDYLAEANHELLVGFNEKNRLQVEEKQGDLLFLRKIWALLSKKV